MNVGEIIKDSLKYPLSDWKKFLFLGILFVITDLDVIAGQFIGNMALIMLLSFVTLPFWLISYGYIFRIIKLSLTGENKLPAFNNWKNMFIDGLKVFITFIIPFIIYSLVFVILYVNKLIPFTGIWQTIVLYAIIIPIVFIAITNKAYYENKSSSASIFKIFKVREILEKISLKGWNNFTKWYIITAIIFLVINSIFMLLNTFIGLIYPIYEPLKFTPLLLDMIDALIITPYAYIFLSRSIGLFYIANEEK